MNAVASQVEDGSLDGHAAVGTLDARFGIGATPTPIRYGPLWVGFDHADALAFIHRGNCEPDRKGAFAATAFLSCQND